MKPLFVKSDNTPKKKSTNDIKQTLLILMILIILLLTITLFSFYKSSSFIYSEFEDMKDIQVLKVKLIPMNNSTITGKIIFTAISEESLNIKGEIYNLIPGETHGLHIINYIDEDPKQKVFTHFNPENTLHSCPSNEEKKYHKGDLGNVIADNKGIARFNFERKIAIHGISGRGVVLLKGEDTCDEGLREDKVEDVIGYGIISVGKYEQKGKVNSKQNWMLRELNKRKIEERNQIITDKPKALLKPLVNNITLPLNETKTPRRLYPSNPRYHKPMSTFKFKSLSPSIDIPSITKTNTTNVDEYINTFKNSLSKLINSNVLLIN